MSHLEVYFVYFLTILASLQAARILAVYPTPSISHQVPMRHLMQELVKRGHEVVIITTDPAFPKGETPANLTEIDIHDISYKIWQEEFVSVQKGSVDSFYKQFEAVISVHSKMLDQQLQIDEVKRLIQDKTQTFDLLFIEAWFRPALVFTHIYKVPVIQISSFGSLNFNYDVMGAPVHPILYPSVVRQRLYNLSYWEKLAELYAQFSTEIYYYSHEKVETESIRKRVDPNMPSLQELINNVDMLFLNIHPIWDDNRPVPPNIVYIGGLPQNPAKDLPKDLKSFLNTSQRGVIYISFGTNVNPSSLPRNVIQTLVNVFTQLPYEVLWKWDQDELPGITKNIKISKWFPQFDILRHPKLKLFVTQGGLQSTGEAIAAGVPMIGLPMLGDQWYNAEKYVHHKIGMKINMDELTEETLLKAINTVIEDESYRLSVAKLRNLISDEPQSPLERAIWWTEYVLRNGGARHLRTPAANMPWLKYYEIELVALMGLILVTFVSMILVVIGWIVKWLKKSTPKIKTN